MKKVVLDTNCLLISLPRISPYRNVWDAFLAGRFTLCVSTDILDEYHDIISAKTSPFVADNVLSTLLNSSNVFFATPFYRFQLISADYDDNKYVDCCIAAGASFIVTNDRHFDVLDTIPFPRVDVKNISSFSNSLL
ncbi:MAG: putative toxin-antitoxin system toxin component, PIN family [Bacteroides sp.]